MNRHSSLFFSSMVCCVLGVLVLAGWICKSERLVQLHPDWVPMQFNTALGFIVMAFVGFACARHHDGRRLSFSSVLSALAVITLAEMASGVDLGVDTLFFDPWTTNRTNFPGRMSPATAVSFFLISFAAAAQSPFLAALAFVPGAYAVLGYCFIGPEGYDYGESTDIALHTAVGFVVFSPTLYAVLRGEHERS